MRESPAGGLKDPDHMRPALQVHHITATWAQAWSCQKAMAMPSLASPFQVSNPPQPFSRCGLSSAQDLSLFIWALTACPQTILTHLQQLDSSLISGQAQPIQECSCPGGPALSTAIKQVSDEVEYIAPVR